MEELAQKVARLEKMVMALSGGVYTVDQVARMMNLSGRTIRRRIKEGKLPVFRSCDRGVIRIPQTTCDRLLQEAA